MEAENEGQWVKSNIKRAAAFRLIWAVLGVGIGLYWWRSGVDNAWFGLLLVGMSVLIFVWSLSDVLKKQETNLLYYDSHQLIYLPQSKQERILPWSEIADITFHSQKKSGALDISFKAAEWSIIIQPKTGGRITIGDSDIKISHRKLYASLKENWEKARK